MFCWLIESFILAPTDAVTPRNCRLDSKHCKLSWSQFLGYVQKHVGKSTLPALIFSQVFDILIQPEVIPSHHLRWLNLSTGLRVESQFWAMAVRERTKSYAAWSLIFWVIGSGTVTLGFCIQICSVHTMHKQVPPKMHCFNNHLRNGLP